MIAPHLLGQYYASHDLPHYGADASDRVVGTGATTLLIPLSEVNEPDGYWNGATGYFCKCGTTILRGHTFHVRNWNAANRTLTLAMPLPVAPVAGDILKLFKGGKYASSQEILNMKISGKQPEVEGVTGPNINGVTIKKASALLGEGILTLRYSAPTKACSLRMGNSGNFGPETILTGDAINCAVYNNDLNGFILIDVALASLPAASATDSLTLSFPKGNFIPNYEGYETNDGVGRTRYHLAILKNNGNDAMTALSVWTEKPVGTSTTCAAPHTPSATAVTTIFASDTHGWPTRGFWVRNFSKNDLRYIDYRSGNTLYARPIPCGVRGTTSQSWDVGDVLEVASDTDIGVDIPNGGVFRDPESDTTAPEGITFSLRQSQDDAAVVDTLAGGAMIGVWFRQTILDGMQSRSDIEGGLYTSWT